MTPALVASPTDTERALQVMEACQADATDGVKDRAEKLLNIFQSDLFQALLGNSHTQVHTHTCCQLVKQLDEHYRCWCSQSGL